jgi:two-component system sensor histidine kinase YesM
MKIAGLDFSFSLNRSFKYRLIAAFCALSIFPVILVQTTSFYNLARILRNNIDTLERSNLVQTRKIVRTKLDFYEDLLYQMYTDDHIIELIGKVDAGDNAEFNSYLLRRALHAYVYTMPYVQSITVMTGGGSLVFDDLLTGYNTKTSWLDVTGGQPARIYDSVISGNETVVMSSKLASNFSSRQYYLFHLAHRVVDYKDIRKRNGVVILSIDEKMLSEICDEVLDSKTAGGSNNTVFILDRLGTIISYPDVAKIGAKLDLPIDGSGRMEAIRSLVWGEGASKRKNLAVYEIEEPETGWSIVLARDERVVYKEISDQQRLIVAVALLSVATLLMIIFYTTGRLTRSIDSVVAAMNTAGAGEFSVRIRKDRKMPLEMEKIADNFNHMIARIDELIREVETATVNRKNAEIAALEAQVNPHFLYNTLDTINWMAIDRNEFEISAAIGALAHILRYGIDDGAGVVEIREEVEWLRNYVSLQQTRLKNSFECVMDIDPDVLDCRIHKLLFQPFVENSIIHAFKGVEGRREIRISIAREDAGILAVIADNGRGIEESTLAALDKQEPEPGRRGHVGMRNAIERIKMYYGGRASVRVESGAGSGTRITIAFPVERCGGEVA